MSCTLRKAVTPPPSAATGWVRVCSSCGFRRQVRQQDVTLLVGTLQETLTIRDGPPSPVTYRQRQFSPSAPSGCSTEANSGGIKPPMKIHDVRPIYPSSMRGMDTDGKVELDAVIGLDGAIKTVQTTDATNRDFADAAESHS